MYTESFKGLCLSSDRFYLVILPLGSKWALIKYYINPLGTTRAKTFMAMICFYTRKDCVSASAV